MAKGLPKKYIKQAGGINKKAWRLYRASKSGSKSRKTTKRRSTRKTASKGGRKTGNKFKLYLPPIVGIVAAVSGKDSPLQYLQSGDINSAMVSLGKRIIGYDANIGGFGSWKNFKYNISKGLLPILMGVGISIAASKLGVNRVLAKAKVPLVRL